MSPPVDMTGRRYDHLEVVGRAGTGPRGQAMWLCRCDCGETAVISGDYLRLHPTATCGCRSWGNKKIPVVPGKRYGRLTVIQEIPPRGRERRVLCQCKCGKETEVYFKYLRSGRTKSCGCRRLGRRWKPAQEKHDPNKARWMMWVNDNYPGGLRGLWDQTRDKIHPSVVHPAEQIVVRAASDAWEEAAAKADPTHYYSREEAAGDQFEGKIKKVIKRLREVLKAARPMTCEYCGVLVRKADLPVPSHGDVILGVLCGSCQKEVGDGEK